MNFFIQTISNIFKVFVLIVKGDEKANAYIQISQAHWLLSWLIMIAGSLIYLVYLPSAFVSNINQEYIPKDANYADFKSANMFSLIFTLFAGYLIVYVLAKLLESSEDIRRYIISQNWVFLISITLMAPLSISLSVENSIFVSVLIFIFMFILFFAYRTLKITLNINGPKSFMILLVLLVFELVMDEMINGWFGLTIQPT